MAEIDTSNRKQIRSHYVNELKLVKTNYIVDRAAKLSKYVGVYKVLNARDKSHYGLKIEDPITKKTVYDGARLCSLFHDEFSNKAPDLIKSLNIDLRRIVDNFGISTTKAWDVSQISENDLMIVVTKFKNNSSSGPDEIPSKLIKALKFAIAKPLEYMANLSVDKGIFPEVWKQVNIIPVMKKCSKLVSNNYILMNTIGRIIESANVGNVMSEVEINLPESLHGSRPKRFTKMVLCSLLDEIKAEKAKKNKVAILALNCSAAFDTLNYQLILSSLKDMDAGPLMLNWTKSLESDCKNSVK